MARPPAPTPGAGTGTQAGPAPDHPPGPEHWPPPAQLTVRDCMTAPAVTVPETASVKHVALTLLDQDLRTVPVTDAKGHLAGIITDGDLIRSQGFATVGGHHLAAFAGRLGRGRDQAAHERPERSGVRLAREIMTRDVISCGPDESLAVAGKRLAHHDLRVLPVVEGGAVVGVLSRHDVLKVYDRADADIKADVNRLLASPMWAPDNSSVDVSVLDGVVVLRGRVEYQRDVRYVEDVVRKVPGVIDVTDHLAWSRPDPAPAYLHDWAWR